MSTLRTRLCKLCGEPFLPDNRAQHTCGCEATDEAVHDELADPALEARIKAGIEADLTSTRAREPEPNEEKP